MKTWHPVLFPTRSLWNVTRWVLTSEKTCEKTKTSTVFSSSRFSCVTLEVSKRTSPFFPKIFPVFSWGWNSKEIFYNCVSFQKPYVTSEFAWNFCLGWWNLTENSGKILWRFASGYGYKRWAPIWRIIPVSKRFITIVGKSPKRGCSPSKWPKWLITGGY